MMESGAILMYLSEKTGIFIPNNNSERWKRDEWLMFQMASLGPMLGQVHHFVKFNAGKSIYAEERYSAEALRIYGVLDTRLSNSQYVTGNNYGIADISIWPWIARFEWQKIDLSKYIILETYGGIYVDMDTISEKSLKDLLENNTKNLILSKLEIKLLSS